MSQKPFYITTALPYVNSEPHIGFALEIVRADIIARYKELAGFEVFFNTGTDEHGQKIFEKAEEAGVSTKDYVDRLVLKFKELNSLLNIKEDINFIRTTDESHIKSAQAFWKRCDEAGYIYKKDYEIKYCVGCELEKTDSELEDGQCLFHPKNEIELIKEENYFFKFSDFGDKLLKFYGEDDDFVLPDFRYKEIKKFIESGLNDFSISRVKAKMPWGIAVPGDDTQVMYVWFDALVNYISAIGWPADEALFKKWHIASGGMVQYAGKDNLRQQSAMWQAMLMSVGLPNSKKVIINGFINDAKGEKMSKSVGNVVGPTELVSEYGVDALRYYLARHVSNFEDHDFSHDGFKEIYNANLANGLGNLTSRIMKMATTNLSEAIKIENITLPDEYKNALDQFDINTTSDFIWRQIGDLDKIIQEKEPFKLIKTNPAEAKNIIKDLVQRLHTIGVLLKPIMPATAEKIITHTTENKMPEIPLFERKD